MMMRPRSIVAWTWFGFVLASSIAVAIAVGTRDGFSSDVLTMPLIGIVYATLGLLVEMRRPGNRLAWLFFVVGTWVALTGSSVLALGDGSVPPASPSMWHVLALVSDNSGYFLGLFVPLFLFFYLFPTGRFLSRRWAWAGCAGVVLMSMAALDVLFQASIGPELGSWTISNPIGFLEANSPVLQGLAAVGIFILIVGGVLAAIVRYRRADAVVRSQIKWVVYGFGVTLASFFGSWARSEGTPGWLDSLLFMGLLTAIPVSVMLAITRYHLYDIDRLVSRTVGYIIVVSLLGLVYVAGAVWLPTRLIGEQSPVFVAASTLAAAALFNPLRKRILELVDRRFNRSRYDAVQLVEQFGSMIGGRNEIVGLVEGTTSVVTEAMQPVSIGLWVRQEH